MSFEEKEEAKVTSDPIIFYSGSTGTAEEMMSFA